MIKNYKLLYTTLKKMLVSELKAIKKSIHNYNRAELRYKVEAEGQVILLKWLLDEYMKELEGKKWGNVSFNSVEYEEWKEKIGE